MTFGINKTQKNNKNKNTQHNDNQHNYKLIDTHRIAAPSITGTQHYELSKEFHCAKCQ